MLLKNLIKKIPKLYRGINIKDLSLDSRKVKKGDLFFAIKGRKLNGERFIKEAIIKGAKAIICSNKYKNNIKEVPTIKVKDVRETLGSVCGKFYKDKPKNIIAVTGTNGKSSVADFFHQILFVNKISVASIGTLGIKYNKNRKNLDLTSPDIISIHKELSRLKKIKINNVIIEASSHGLKQMRLNGINFLAGIFTNFSQDHLDYHKTMKEYFKSKMILFKKLIKENKYIITDESLKEFSTIKRISKQKKINLLTIKSEIKKLRKKLNSKLVGNFQIKNLSMSVKAAKLCGLKEGQVNKGIKKIHNVNGRLQLVRTLPNKTKVFLDYAHTPDALSIVLKSLKNHFNKNLNLVFGCGGERDTKKRPIMSKIAKNYCNFIYVTDDNPRNENPIKIRKEIIRNLKNKSYLEIPSRTKAIKAAMKNSKPNEIILVAGKGHENYQDYGNKILKISDKDIIKKTKIKNKKFNKKLFNLDYNSAMLKKILNTKKNYKFLGSSINSKDIKTGNLFIAIKGENKDGHEYISESLKRGASYCVTNKRKTIKKLNKIITCDNTNKFLNKLAYEKRIASRAKVIAVTGSSGKTTVKTLLGNLLSNFGETFFSPKSYNNHYGVPISLCNLEAYHSYGIFEVGMSKAGEIKKLSKLVMPDIAIITNIAEAHIENFKNLSGIAKAKGEIIQNIKKNGTLVLNRDDVFFNYLNNLARKKNIKTVSFGTSNKSDIYLLKKKFTNEKYIYKIKAADEIVQIKSRNTNIYNILSSLAVLKILNLDVKKILNSLELTKPLDGRGKIFKINRYNTSFQLIDESYNANPLSVKNAIVNLSKIKKRNFKKYILLGDMLELGNKSDFYHRKLSKIINNTDIDKVFVYGNNVLNTFKHTKKNKKGNILQHLNDFDKVFSKIIKKNDYLMIKGSNATGLNGLSRNLTKGGVSAF